MVLTDLPTDYYTRGYCTRCGSEVVVALCGRPVFAEGQLVTCGRYVPFEGDDQLVAISGVQVT